MSRQFKFRVWDVQLKKFNYFDLYTAWGNIPSDSTENICEWTGLQDKNGTDIYEHDLVDYWGDDGLYRVVFSFGQFFMEREDESGVADFDNMIKQTKIEVISNLFLTEQLIG